MLRHGDAGSRSELSDGQPALPTPSPKALHALRPARVCRCWWSPWRHAASWMPRPPCASAPPSAPIGSWHMRPRCWPRTRQVGNFGMSAGCVHRRRAALGRAHIARLPCVGCSWCAICPRVLAIFRMPTGSSLGAAQVGCGAAAGMARLLNPPPGVALAPPPSAGASVLARELPHLGGCQVEFYTIEYAAALLPHAPTWPLAAAYLAWCPAHGQGALEAALRALPLDAGDPWPATKAAELATFHGLARAEQGETPPCAPVAGLPALCTAAAARLLLLTWWRVGGVGELVSPSFVLVAAQLSPVAQAAVNLGDLRRCLCSGRWLSRTPGHPACPPTPVQMCCARRACCAGRPGSPVQRSPGLPAAATPPASTSPWPPWPGRSVLGRAPLTPQPWRPCSRCWRRCHLAARTPPCWRCTACWSGAAAMVLPAAAAAAAAGAACTPRWRRLRSCPRRCGTAACSWCAARCRRCRRGPWERPTCSGCCSGCWWVAPAPRCAAVLWLYSGPAVCCIAVRWRCLGCSYPLSRACPKPCWVHKRPAWLTRLASLPYSFLASSSCPPQSAEARLPRGKQDQQGDAAGLASSIQVARLALVRALAAAHMQQQRGAAAPGQPPRPLGAPA